MKWANREQAGKYLAEVIAKLVLEKPYVLAIPRGGIIVANEIAKILNCPLDVIVSRKIRHPHNEEFAIGYVCEDYSPVLGFKPWDLQCKAFQIERNIDRAIEEVWQKVELFRGGEPLPDFEGYDVLIVDDGIATGWTVQGAIAYLTFRRKPKSVSLVLPVMSEKEYKIFQSKVRVICGTIIPEELFYAVGQAYEDFRPVEDEEVLEILKEGRENNRG